MSALPPLTVLLHKAAGVPAARALQQAWLELALGSEWPPEGFKEWLPLPDAASGLSVWSSDRATVRRLLDWRRPLEIEWLLSLPMAEAPPTIARLQGAGLRASLGHERDGMGQWRLVGKGGAALDIGLALDVDQLPEGWRLRRQRVGRLGVSPLAAGQARVAGDFEKF